MTTYMARSKWTSAGRGGSSLSGSGLQGIAAHWPGTTTNAYGVESAATVAARLRGWRAYHLSRGWSDIGYNYAVDQAGRLWDLRGASRVGAHCASPSNSNANHEWIGVLFILGDNEAPSAAMLEAFRDFRYNVFLRRWAGRTDLTGHGRAPGVPGAQTSCPGPYVAGKITDGSLRKRPGGAAPAPEEEEDFMAGVVETREQFKALVVEALAEALEEDTGNTRLRQAVALHQQNVVFTDPDVQKSIATAVLDWKNPEVEGGDISVYAMLRDIRAAVVDNPKE